MEDLLSSTFSIRLFKYLSHLLFPTTFTMTHYKPYYIDEGSETQIQVTKLK